MVNMRKIMKRDPIDLGFGFSGESNENGIFISVEAMDEVEKPGNKKEYIHTIFPGAFAMLLEDDEIVYTITDSIVETEEQKEYRDQESLRIKKIRRNLMICSAICWILMIPAIFVNWYLPNVCIAFAFIFMALTNIPVYVYMTWMYLIGDERHKQIARFHYAEHAVINAYNDLRKVPTLEEIKNYSGFAYSCGIALEFMKALDFLVLGLCRFVPGIWFLLAVFLSLPLVSWWVKKGLYITEFISLRNPSDVEYQVAITALSKALEMKEKIDEIRNSFGKENIAQIIITIGGPENDT